MTSPAKDQVRASTPALESPRWQLLRAWMVAVIREAEEKGAGRDSR